MGVLIIKRQPPTRIVVSNRNVLFIPRPFVSTMLLLVFPDPLWTPWSPPVRICQGSFIIFAENSVMLVWNKLWNPLVPNFLTSLFPLSTWYYHDCQPLIDCDQKSHWQGNPLANSSKCLLWASNESWPKVDIGFMFRLFPKLLGIPKAIRDSSDNRQREEPLFPYFLLS